MRDRAELRGREAVLRGRALVLPAGFAAVAPRFAPELLFVAPVFFFAPDERVAPPVVDLARAGDFLAVEVLCAAVPRALVLRPLLRALPDDDGEPEPELALASPSTLHLPDITRCAASATASAMIDPSLVALDITLLAACDAVSAASRPASRILRRAAGLALIAAAAAARPAASISLLIAAFASLSIVSFDRDEEPEDVFFEDLAIALLPASGDRHFSAVTVPK